MSIENAAAFIDKARADEGLQQKAVAAMAGKDPQGRMEALAALGKSLGFDFTPTEAIQIRASVRKALFENGSLTGELDDLDLQAVTGGLTQVQSWQIGSAVGIAAGQLGPFGAGGFIGAGAAAGATTAAQGGSTEDVILAVGQGMNDFGEKVNNFFSSLFGG